MAQPQHQQQEQQQQERQLRLQQRRGRYQGHLHSLHQRASTGSLGEALQAAATSYPSTRAGHTALQACDAFCC